jgi:prevent-host-death family protein
MKNASIRDLRHNTSEVLRWVEQGETVQVQKRGVTVAVLSRPVPVKKKKVVMPDFAARLQKIYGDKMMPTTATEELEWERGDR